MTLIEKNSCSLDLAKFLIIDCTINIDCDYLEINTNEKSGAAIFVVTDNINSLNILKSINTETVTTVPYFKNLGKNNTIINNLNICSIIFDIVCGNIFCFPKKQPLYIALELIKGIVKTIDINKKYLIKYNFIDTMANMLDRLSSKGV